MPAIKYYLEKHKSLIVPKSKDWKSQDGKKWKGRKPGSYKWYEIQDARDYYKEFEKVKTNLSRDLSRTKLYN